VVEVPVPRRSIPWYRYQRAFHEVEADLSALGAPIGWHSRAERPAALDIGSLLVPTQSAPLSREAGGLSSPP
jgi:hypothetical protein